MDHSPLVTEKIAAGAKFLQGFRRKYPPMVAFWLLPSENGRWNLYVSSDRIRHESIREAYFEVSRVAGKMRDPNFDQFEVKLLPASDPMAVAASSIYKSSSTRIPAHLFDRVLGNVSAQELYVYPPNGK